MHIAGGVGIRPGDGCGEGLDQGYCEIAGTGGGLGQDGQVEFLGPAGFLDRGNRARRNDTGRGFRACQRSFKIEHVLQVGEVVTYGAHGGARQHRRQQRG